MQNGSIQYVVALLQIVHMYMYTLHAVIIHSHELPVCVGMY